LERFESPCLSGSPYRLFYAQILQVVGVADSSTAGFLTQVAVPMHIPGIVRGRIRNKTVLRRTELANATLVLRQLGRKYGGACLARAPWNGR